LIKREKEIKGMKKILNERKTSTCQKRESYESKSNPLRERKSESDQARARATLTPTKGMRV